MKISPVSPTRTKLLKTFVLSVAFGVASCGLKEDLSEIAPEGDTGNATGGKSTGGATSSARKSGTGGSTKSNYATGGKASADTEGNDSDSGDVGGAKATTSSGGASNADDTDGEGGIDASPKGGSTGRTSTTRTSKVTAGGTGNMSVPSGGAKSSSAGGASNSSSNGGTKATSAGGAGNTGNGGSSNGGSKAATGGAATGGAATGGAATGGAATGGAATGGVATGGKAATGGAATGGVATGGKAATGGAATGGAPTTTSTPPINSSCSEGQKSLTANGTGTHCGYTYEYWKDQGTGTLTLKSDGFSVNWNNINNLLGRKGVRPGTGNEIVTYEANYQPNGNSYLCIYGWFKNPLVEYYIVDSWGTWRPPGGQGLQGTVTCDGATYDIYKLPRTGPSIEGDNTSFTQYFNVRQQKRTSGTIDVGCHIASWKAKGMSVGSFYEVSMTVEGYQSSGTADVKFSMK